MNKILVSSACFLWLFCSEALAKETKPFQASKMSSREKLRVATAEDQSIYVLQPRAYSKRGKVEITPLAFVALNPKFVLYAGGGLSLAYHIRENLALELVSSVPYAMYRDYSQLVYEVDQLEKLMPERVDLKQMNYFGSLSIQYSAFYGKLTLFRQILLDYDFYVTAGFGLVSTLESCIPGRGDECVETGYSHGVRNPVDLTDRYKVAANLGGGLRFFFQDNLGVKFEVRDITYADRDVTDQSTDIRSQIMFFMGVSVLL